VRKDFKYLDETDFKLFDRFEGNFENQKIGIKPNIAKYKTKLKSIAMKHFKILLILTCFSFSMARTQESKSQQAECIPHNRIVE